MSFSNNEKEFQLALLAEHRRADGRGFDEMRELELRFGAELGNVEVVLGRTRLVVQVSATVRQPRVERPFEGLFHISTDISSMASLQFENGKSGQEEVVVSRIIEKAIRRSNALDLESLCIEAGRRCWMVRADVHYLQYDGNFVDASCIGVIAALLHYRRPDTSIDGNHVIVHSAKERPPVPLSILHIPITLTWTFIPLTEGEKLDVKPGEDDADDDDVNGDETKEKGTVAVLDATAIEQSLRNGQITVTINRDREVCQITKAGGTPIKPETLMRFISDAHSAAQRISKQIEEGLAADFARREAGVIRQPAVHSR